jgi:hypothetical protein
VPPARALNAFMKTLLALFASSALLAGCVAVPLDPGPAVYAAPPVVVQPAFGYYYRSGPYWHHRYWR